MALTAGSTATMHDFRDLGYLAIVLPDGKQLALNGQLVRVLRIQADGMVAFRPEPWNFPAGIWPNSWLATAEYFHPHEP